MKRNGPAATIAAIRTILLVILLLGLFGTGAELLLLGHTDGFWQLIPLLLILISLTVLGWHAAQRRTLSIRVLQGAMILFVASGVAGLWLHYQGNVEFKLETKPSLSGMALFWEAMKGKSPPALAPGTMIQLGLLGLAYTYRHPALAGQAEDESRKEEK